MDLKKLQNLPKKPKPKPKKKRTRKKELTKNERILYTILLVICIPLGILAFVYYNAGLMETIILAKGLYQTEKNLGLPTDDKTVPYAESVNHGKPTHLSNQENVFDLINKEEKNQQVKRVEVNVNMLKGVDILNLETLKIVQNLF